MSYKITTWQYDNVNKSAQKDDNNGDCEEEHSVAQIIVRIEQFGENAIE